MGGRLDLKHAVRVGKSEPGISEPWRQPGESSRQTEIWAPVLLLTTLVGGPTQRPCCAPLCLAPTSPADWSQNQDCSPHASMSRPGCLLLLKLFNFSDLASDFFSFGSFLDASDIPLLIHFLLNERGVTIDNHKESAYKRRSLGGFSVNTVLCPLLWAELVP